MRKTMLTLMLLLCVLCLPLSGTGEVPAEPAGVEGTAAALLAEPWMPEGAAFTWEETEDLQRVRLTLNGEPAAELILDGAGETCAAYYLAEGFILPEMAQLPAAVRDFPVTDLTWMELEPTAEAVFTRFRGENPGRHREPCPVARLSGTDWLFGLQNEDETYAALLVLRCPEEEGKAPRLMAYVDMERNRSVRWPGCLSVGEAMEGALAECAARYGRDAADHLEVESIELVLTGSGLFSMAYDEETGDEPETPCWLFVLVDERADPDSPDHDPTVELYRYHVLLSPMDGGILEIWTEMFGFG